MFLTLLIFGVYAFILYGQAFPHHFPYPSTAWPGDEKGRERDWKALWNSKLNPLYFFGTHLFLSSSLILVHFSCVYSIQNYFVTFLPNALFYFYYPLCFSKLRNKDEWWKGDYSGRKWGHLPPKEKQQFFLLMFGLLLAMTWIVFSARDFPLHCELNRPD